MKFLKFSGIQILAATEKGADKYYEVDGTLPTAIIMGSEEFGVSTDLLKMADKLVTIDVMGEIESLNVSVACGAFLYEVVRQRL